MQGYAATPPVPVAPVSVAVNSGLEGQKAAPQHMPTAQPTVQPVQQPVSEPQGPPPAAPVRSEAPKSAWNPSDSPEKAWGIFLEVLRKNRPHMAPLLAKSALKKVAGKSIEIEITTSRFNVGRLNSGKKNELEEEIRAWFGPGMDVTLHTIIAGEEAPSGARQGADRLKKEAKDHPVIHEAIRVLGGRVDVNIIKEEDNEKHG